MNLTQHGFNHESFSILRVFKTGVWSLPGSCSRKCSAWQLHFPSSPPVGAVSCMCTTTQRKNAKLTWWVNSSHHHAHQSHDLMSQPPFGSLLSPPSVSSDDEGPRSRAALGGSHEFRPHDLQDEDEEGSRQMLLFHLIPIKTSAAFPLMRQIPVNLGDSFLCCCLCRCLLVLIKPSDHMLPPAGRHTRRSQ